MVTIFIALAYFIFSGSILYRCYKMNTYGVVHFLFLLTIYNYTIRPILSYNFDYWLDNRYMYPNQELYNLTYIQAVIPSLIIQIGYYLGLKKFVKKQLNASIVGKSSFQKDITLYVIICILLVGYLTSRVGFSWLSTNRSVSATLIIPEFRYLFPLFIFISLVIYFRQYWAFKQKAYLPVILFFLISGFFFTLFSQRGYLVYMLLFTIPFFGNKKLLIPVGIIYIIFTVFILRLVGTEGSNYNDAASIIASNGDTIDTWFIVNDYVKQKGYLFGKGIISNFLNILPISVRSELNFTSTWDEMNFFYFGDNYLDSQFGYNTNSYQELYMNFGYFGFVLLYPMGKLLAKLDNKVSSYRKKGKYGIKAAVEFMKIQLIFAFGSFQWLFMFLILKIMHKIIKKIENTNHR